VAIGVENLLFIFESLAFPVRLQGKFLAHKHNKEFLHQYTARNRFISSLVFDRPQIVIGTSATIV